MSGSQPSTAPSPQQQAAAAYTANLNARKAVTSLALPEEQVIFTQGSLTQAANPVLNIPPRNVGLITGFLLEVSATFATAAGATGTLNPLGGPANTLSQIQFTDLSNNVRINTTGLHMATLATMRRRHVLGASYTSDTPLGFAAAWTNVIQAPATIAASTTYTTNMIYEIPIAYSQDDLRGGIYANVINATMNLQLTFNPNFMQLASAADHTGCVYAITGALPVPTYQVVVYQQYLDQIPPGKNGPILPQGDLSTIYEIKNTNLTGLASGQDFPVPYANFRAFLSTMLILDNGGLLYPGTDLNYISLQSANFVNIFKLDPINLAFKHRSWFLNDTPRGMYLINTRRKPLSTIQYGNLQLNINMGTPAQALAAGSVVLVGYEAMAQQNAIFQAGSLAGG